MQRSFLELYSPYMNRKDYNNNTTLNSNGEERTDTCFT